MMASMFRLLPGAVIVVFTVATGAEGVTLAGVAGLETGRWAHSQNGE